jgi:hypothetical protein
MSLNFGSIFLIEDLIKPKKAKIRNIISDRAWNDNKN